ncbi:TolC family protein [Salinisphaera sp. USBA-960]|nr:TolC family protein [Salifodinibacter halophilus]NNC27217.1 TolC family protein [Salifodinibacter halophilus]
MRFFLLLGIVAGLAWAVSVNAADRAQRPPKPLTLEQALAWGQDNNPTLRGARIELRRQQGALEHADRSVPSNPELQFKAGDRDRPDGTSTTDIGIRLSQELWIAGQGGLREDAAQASVSGAQAKLDFLQQSIAARIRAAFLKVLVAKRAVATAEQVLAVNRDLSEYAQRRLDAGQGTRLQTNTARIGAGRARALLAKAENRHTRARLRLAELLALDPSQPLPLTGELTPSQLAIPSEKKLLRRAVQRRGDLAAAGQAVTAAQGKLKLARRRIIPNLRVFGFYKEENKNEIAGGGVAVELPLLHQYEGERQQANARLDAARLERRTLQVTVRQQVLEALSDYRNARKRVAALGDDVVAAARENFELTQRAIEAGELGAPALTTAQDTLINTRREYLEALEALVTAGSDLERATGGLLVMDNPAKPNGATQ